MFIAFTVEGVKKYTIFWGFDTFVNEGMWRSVNLHFKGKVLQRFTTKIVFHMRQTALMKLYFQNTIYHFLNDSHHIAVD